MSTVQRPTDWGHDPVLNPDFKPLNPDELVQGVRYIKMADAVKGSLSQLPDGWDGYASYIDNYGGYPELVTRKEATGAFLLSITIFGGKARCGDVEPHGMQASALPNWLDHEALTDGSPSWVYTNAGNMALCNQFIGQRKVIRWSAHYGVGWHICGPSSCGYPQADITQCYDKGLNGENYDRSLGFAYVIPSQVTSGSHGIANASLTFNLLTGAWNIHPAPGNVQFDSEDRSASAEVQFDLHNGQWRVTPIKAGASGQ
jgi:hypothetical protein